MTQPVVVFIRGLFREARHWGDVLDLVQDVLPELKVEAIDLPGSGAKWSEESPASISEIMEQLRRERLPGTKYYLVGLSLGGMVALEWAIRHPQEVAKCIIVNTSAKPFGHFYQRLRWQIYPNVLRALHSQPERRERLIYRMVSNKPLDPNRVEQWIDIARTRPISVSNCIQQLVAASRYKVLSEPQCPVLSIVSARDRLVDTQVCIEMANSMKMELTVHDWAGHDLPMDDPDWFVQQVCRFILKP
ncbi:alpha/beta fold hydrolase [Vibrio sp.]|uniref:alpha/beta fold hydrolase n=1 Tax=Vibrio sp. TaxID=678 RepID=UPI003D1282A1